MIARSALMRTESRGAHYRQDFPQPDPAWLRNIYLKPCGRRHAHSAVEPVQFTRLTLPEMDDRCTIYDTIETAARDLYWKALKDIPEDVRRALEAAAWTPRSKHGQCRRPSR